MPQTTRTLNLKEFADIKHIVSLKSEARKEMQGDSAYAAPLPREVCLQLTYACNLRCTHCYQWSEQGFFRDYSIDKQRTSLDIGIVEDILEMTAPQRSKLFLWGGEPLMYRQFDKVAELLQRYPRTVVMCTNGLLMKRHVKALTAIEDMNILVSLDGLKDDHDALRGSGSFERTTKNIKAMLALRETGEFRGELSLNCMVSHATVHRMYEFMEWAEDLGVNTVYFQFPWYITPEVARAMDRLYAECFEWLGRKPDTTRATWHSYTYRLPPELVPTLRDSMTRLAERTWNIRIRYQRRWPWTTSRTSSSAGRSRCSTAAAAWPCPTGWRCTPTATSARASSSPSSRSATCTRRPPPNCGRARTSAGSGRSWRRTA